MPHWIITGRSGMGKGAIMKSIILPSWRARGVKVFVLDPLEMPGWNADYQTRDPFAFMKEISQWRNIVTVIDEYLKITRDYRAMVACEEAATVMRNWGHLHYAMAQRVKMIPPNVRNQCVNGITFRQQQEDLADIADMFDQPELKEAHTFQPGECVLTEGLKPTVKMRVNLIKRRK